LPGGGDGGGGGGGFGVAVIVAEGVGQQTTAELYVTVGGDDNTDLSHGAWERDPEPKKAEPRKQRGEQISNKHVQM
jgi:hypothetical protein